MRVTIQDFFVIFRLKFCLLPFEKSAFDCVMLMCGFPLYRGLFPLGCSITEPLVLALGNEEVVKLFLQVFYHTNEVGEKLYSGNQYLSRMRGCAG